MAEDASNVVNAFPSRFVAELGLAAIAIGLICQAGDRLPDAGSRTISACSWFLGSRTPHDGRDHRRLAVAPRLEGGRRRLSLNPPTSRREVHHGRPLVMHDGSVENYYHPSSEGTFRVPSPETARILRWIEA